MKLTKMTCIFAIVLMLLTGSAMSQTQAIPPQLMIFNAGIALPDGIAIDAQGRVLVHSEAVSRTEVVQFDAYGMFLNQVIFGDGVFDKTRFIGSRFSYDTMLHRIIMLTPEGDVYQLHPDGLQVAPNVISILPETIVANQVYDLHTGQITSFALTPDTLLHYGDVALFRPSMLPQQLHLIVTGTVDHLSTPPLPFVMDIILDPLASLVAAQIVLTSSASSLTVDSETRGVAVNAHGVGLTTLPVADPLIPGETKEVAVAFSASTALVAPVLLPQPVMLLNGLDVTSAGMASDQAGHFYIASGDRGSSACEPHRSGAILVMPVDANGLPLGLALPATTVPAMPPPLGVLDPLACIPIAEAIDDIVSSRDLAVSPVDQRLVITVNNRDLVLFILQP